MDGIDTTHSEFDGITLIEYLMHIWKIFGSHGTHLCTILGKNYGVFNARSLPTMTLIAVRIFAMRNNNCYFIKWI